jgi:hypothetical protein
MWMLEWQRTTRRRSRPIFAASLLAVIVAGPGLAASPDLRPSAAPEPRGGVWQAADATESERERFADETRPRMAEWEKRLQEAKKGVRSGADEAGRKLDGAWSDVKDKWSQVEKASNDGWTRAKTDFERAWRNLERTWNDTTN